MMYIVLDTCVWLELIKVDTSRDHTPFDELMYWFENHHAACVTTKNLIAEWSRHKMRKKEVLSEIIKRFGSDASSVFSTITPLDKLYAPNIVETKLDERIGRVDLLFSSIAEVAEETDEIFLKAAKMSLDCIAPNHNKDSFRDTVNYLTLIRYITKKGYSNSHFATINFKDYSDPQSKVHIHPQLKHTFSEAGLEYHYFEPSKENFGGILMNKILRKSLPDYTQHLQEIRENEERQKILNAEREKASRMDEIDPDFLEYSGYIDRITLKTEPSETDKAFLDLLFEKHPAYEKYFFRRLIQNGVV